VEYRTGSFDHGGRRLAYDVYGEGDRVLVYMHGLLLDSEMNRGIAKALAARGSRVVLLDLLGHGRSAKPTHASEFRIDAYAGQVFAVLDELGVAEAVLGGMSLGANVSLFAATERPDRVRALVLEMPVLERAVPPAALMFVSLLMGVHYGRRVLRATAPVLRSAPRGPFGSLNSLLDAWSMEPETIAAVLHGVLVGPVVPTAERRAAITAPALVLAHRNDFLHPFDDAARLSEVLPRGRLLRARSPVELRLQPERLTGEIASFLDDVWAGPDASGKPERRRA
jgi:pimeloyl-ACP methyl ester carboxylesterase